MNFKQYYFYIIFIFLFNGYSQKNTNDKIDTRPNILLITPSNIGIDQFKQYGGLNHKTPNIDFLANNGVTLNYYFGRSNYVASYRAILSGTSNALVGWESNDWPLKFSGRLAERIREVGYETCFVGKWGFPNDAENVNDFILQRAENKTGRQFSYPWTEGFEHYYGIFNPIDKKADWNEVAGDVYWKAETYQTSGFKILSSANNGYLPQKNVHFIKAFLDYVNIKQTHTPFFLWWSPVYMWYHAKDWYKETPDSLKKKQFTKHQIQKGNGARSKKENEIYYANIRYMDKMIGEVILKLKENKMIENTIIIFASLSGTTYGITGIYDGHNVLGANSFLPESKNPSEYDIILNKNHLERNHRLPMFVHWPRYIKEKSINSYIFSAKDFFITLGKLTHAKGINQYVSQEYYKAYDFSPIFRGHNNKGERRYAVHMFFAHRGLDRREELPNLIWAQTQEYKLYADGRFYRLRNSPDEDKQASRISPLENAIKKSLEKIIDSYPRYRPQWYREEDPLYNL